MPKFAVYATVVGGKYIGTFVAKNAAEAEEKAQNCYNASVSLCHQCSSECENAELTEFQVESASEDAEVDNGRS